jgi:hypothetical protein
VKEAGKTCVWEGKNREGVSYDSEFEPGCVREADAMDGKMKQRGRQVQVYTYLA